MAVHAGQSPAGHRRRRRRVHQHPVHQHHHHALQPPHPRRRRPAHPAASAARRRRHRHVAEARLRLLHRLHGDVRRLHEPVHIQPADGARAVRRLPHAVRRLRVRRPARVRHAPASRAHRRYCHRDGHPEHWYPDRADEVLSSAARGRSIGRRAGCCRHVHADPAVDRHGGTRSAPALVLQ